MVRVTTRSRGNREASCLLGLLQRDAIDEGLAFLLVLELEAVRLELFSLEAAEAPVIDVIGSQMRLFAVHLDIVGILHVQPVAAEIYSDNVLELHRTFCRRCVESDVLTTL